MLHSFACDTFVMDGFVGSTGVLAITNVDPDHSLLSRCPSLTTAWLHGRDPGNRPGLTSAVA